MLRYMNKPRSKCKSVLVLLQEEDLAATFPIVEDPMLHCGDIFEISETQMVVYEITYIADDKMTHKLYRCELLKYVLDKKTLDLLIKKDKRWEIHEF